jgi:hypothetical protein
MAVCWGSRVSCVRAGIGRSVCLSRRRDRPRRSACSGGARWGAADRPVPDAAAVTLDRMAGEATGVARMGKQTAVVAAHATQRGPSGATVRESGAGRAGVAARPDQAVALSNMPRRRAPADARPTRPSQARFGSDRAGRLSARRWSWLAAWSGAGAAEITRCAPKLPATEASHARRAVSPRRALERSEASALGGGHAHRGESAAVLRAWPGLRPTQAAAALERAGRLAGAAASDAGAAGSRCALWEEPPDSRAAERTARLERSGRIRAALESAEQIGADRTASWAVAISRGSAPRQGQRSDAVSLTRAAARGPRHPKRSSRASSQASCWLAVIAAHCRFTAAHTPQICAPGAGRQTPSSPSTGSGRAARGARPRRVAPEERGALLDESPALEGSSRRSCATTPRRLPRRGRSEPRRCRRGGRISGGVSARLELIVACGNASARLGSGEGRRGREQRAAAGRVTAAAKKPWYHTPRGSTICWCA